ncbi:MAG: hypothetical protein Q8N99_02345 [Nanoarchaeota archaeon]|nr:hypothetical protein [Nanoarchaeota archaeon]
MIYGHNKRASLDEIIKRMDGVDWDEIPDVKWNEDLLTIKEKLFREFLIGFMILVTLI